MSQEALPVTPEEVCSRAMVLCGMEPMTSFSDTDRDEVVTASQLYELMVMGSLSSFPWTFATGEQQLELAAHDPLDRYETAWIMPSLPMPLQLQSITVDGIVREYDIVQGLIYMHTDPTDVVIARYQYRVEEAYWLPQFTMHMVYELAGIFAVSVTRKSAQITAFEQMSQIQFSRAKTRDSQGHSAKRARMGSLRRGIKNWPGNIAR